MSARTPFPVHAAALGLALLALAAGPSRAADWETCWGHYEASRWEDSAACFEELVAEFEGWAWGQHYLGVSYHGIGEQEKALEAFRKAQEAMPGDEAPSWEPFFMAAQIHRQRDQCRKGMDALQRGKQLMPPEARPDLLRLRGQLHYCLGNWSDAVEDLDDAGDDDFDTLYLIGTAQYKAGNLEAATDALEEALELRPSHASTLDFLMKALTRRAEGAAGDRAQQQLWARAAERAEERVEQQPDSVEAHNQLARAYMGAKRYRMAEAEFDEVLRLDPNHCHARFNRAQIHLSEKRWNRAIADAGKAVGCLDRQPKRSAHMVMGDAYWGQATAAVNALEENDIGGRRQAIRTIRRAEDQYRAAESIRGSSGLEGKLALIPDAVDRLEKQVEAIEFNVEAERKNREAEAERKRQEELREKARQGG